MTTPVTERIYEDTDTSHHLDTAVDLIRLSDQYRQSAILHYAAAERLFDLTQEPISAAALAARLGFVENKARILLDALVALSLLNRADGLYQNTEATRRFLVTSSPEHLGPIIDHQRLQWESWGRLDEVLRSEESLPFQQEKRLAHDRAAREAFNGAMVRLSQPIVDSVRQLSVFETARHVIDLAGGHGTYIARIAETHPQLTGEIWDLPTTEDAAGATLASRGLDGRITFARKDITRAEHYQDARADVVMLNDCLHYFTWESVESVIRLAASIVAPGGALLILTMRLEEDRVRPALSADFSLHMMVNTADGELHPTPWIGDVMSGQGLDVTEQVVGRYSLLIGKRG